MDLLIKAAKIIDTTSKFHQKVVDILIKNGKIEKIGSSIKNPGVNEFTSKNLHISKGWVDLSVHYQDPGNEHKESIQTGLKASAAGGFTTVCVVPNTDPVRDSKSQIEYLINQSKNQLVSALPYGAVSKDLKGENLAELHDMHTSGAIGFTDGKASIRNPNMLYRGLLYTKSFNGLIVNFPNTYELSAAGVMNEGAISTQLGLKGIAEIAEELMVNRDLSLLEYTEGKLHLSTISTPKSLHSIKEAKKSGLRVSCDVASYNLLLSDEDLFDFDSRYKTLPPLRSKNTIQELIKGIKQNTIDAICSDHLPEDIEQKKIEFDYAAFGVINAQTAFSSANTALHQKVPLERIIELFTEGPSKIIGLKQSEIKEGIVANLSLFDPSREFVFSKEQVLSKSNNSPFFGRKLIGKVLGVINNNKSNFNNH